MNNRKFIITVFPEIGNAQTVTLPFPDNIGIDNDDYIDCWIDDNLTNVQAWEWCNKNQ